MNKWVRMAAKLYPSGWRRRYGPEFDALLDDTRSGWRDVADVLWGAIMMQMSMWSYRNATVACGLAGLILAAGLAFWLPNLYVSRALMRMDWEVINENNSEPPLHRGDAWNQKMKQIADQAFSRSSLASIVQRPDLNLYQSKRASQPLEDVIDQMKRKDIRIEALNANSHPTNFIVAFTYPDPAIARKTAEALVTKLVDANQILSRNGANRETSASLDLLDPASLPKKPTAPNRLEIALLGLGAGALAGILLVTFRRKSAVR